MTAQAKSTRLVLYSRPRFEVAGEARSRLHTDLMRLETSEDEDGMACLEAVFRNWGRARESSASGFLYFDREILDLGRELVVRAGEVDNEDVIFRGFITAIEGVYPELRSPELVVRAEDRLQLLRMRQRTRFFENRTDTDMNDDVASDHGLSADAQAEGPTHEEFWQVNQSDLSFLRERARAVDARLMFDNGNLTFRRRRENGDAPIRLTRENELLRFHVSADLAHQRREVRVHGYSVDDKEGIHTRATADDLDEANGAGRTGPEVLQELELDAIEDLHLEMPATSDEAVGLARALLRRRARHFVRGRGVTNGTPAMHVGTRLDMVDVGPWFSGVYHVAQVRHTFDERDGLRTHFTAERVDLGE